MTRKNNDNQRTRNVHILMVGLDLNPPWVEGIRNTVKSFSQLLMEDGYKVLVLTKGYENQPHSDLVEGIQYYRIPVRHSSYYLSGAFTFLAKLPLRLIRLTKCEKVNIIHGHSVYPILGIILGIASKIAGTKSIFTLYSTPLNRNKQHNQSIITNILNFTKNKWLAKILSFFTDVIVVTSNNTKRNLTSMKINKNKIKYIPVGVNLALFKPLNRSGEIKTKLNIHPDRNIILFAGDISPWKGLDIFLKSVSTVSKKYPNILCIIMTKGLYEHERERRKEITNFIKSRDIEEYIYILGKYNNIQEIYEISDIVVFPFVSSFSVMDIPLSLLEAMAMGKPAYL